MNNAIKEKMEEEFFLNTIGVYSTGLDEQAEYSISIFKLKRALNQALTDIHTKGHESGANGVVDWIEDKFHGMIAPLESKHQITIEVGMLENILKEARTHYKDNK